MYHRQERLIQLYKDTSCNMRKLTLGLRFGRTYQIMLIQEITNTIRVITAEYVDFHAMADVLDFYRFKRSDGEEIITLAGINYGRIRNDGWIYRYV